MDGSEDMNDLHGERRLRRIARDRAFAARFERADPDEPTAVSARVRASLAAHVAVEEPVRAITLDAPGGSPGGRDRFTMTWTPGTVTLSGAYGDFRLDHGNALCTFAGGMAWLAQADHDYLLGKSDARRAYDPAATAAAIVRQANEEAIVGLLAIRDDLAEEREARRDPEWAEDPLEAVAAWPRVVGTGRDGDPDGGAPAGHGLWLRLHRALGGSDDASAAILSPTGRRRIGRDLERLLRQGAEEAHALLGDVGLDGWWVSQSWTPATVRRVEALRRAARSALAASTGCRASAA